MTKADNPPAGEESYTRLRRCDMSKVKKVSDKDSNTYGYTLWCPGCEEHHRVGTEWQFNGDMEKPTFSPSLLVWLDPNPSADPKHEPTGKYRNGFRCHSFIREGRIEFLGDCTHKLAGQTVELPELEL